VSFEDLALLNWRLAEAYLLDAEKQLKLMIERLEASYLNVKEIKAGMRSKKASGGGGGS